MSRPPKRPPTRTELEEQVMLLSARLANEVNRHADAIAAKDREIDALLADRRNLLAIVHRVVCGVP